MSQPRLAGPALVLALAAPLAGASDAGVPAQAYQDLRWRLVGPLRAGWATCAEGVPNQPDTFYFGAVDGGVFKTTDAGRTWRALFTHESVASVGALAIAPSDPSVLYVGTGQIGQRYDIVTGGGVFRSSDGGETWQRAGLEESHHVGRILVDPKDPNIVVVAALGHIFGPNPERGVFRTTDGGKTWERVLFVDENTGGVDLAADPGRPEIVYAALWQARRYPWQAYFTPTVGPGSGIYKSADAGKTWARLSGPGLPAGPLGRIGLAVAPGSEGQRVYATINAPKDPGLYRSDDAGASWQRVNADGALAASYFSRLTVDPGNADVVYVMGRSVARSSDAGKTFTLTKGAPGGDDYHFLWINPAHPERMILAADQGATISVNGGKTWSSWYNQPTGQFYHVATDDRFPYWIYSSQQDSGTVGIASRSDYGQLTFRDWHPVGGDERDFSIPDPEDPEIVYVSGLGGRLSRWDGRTGRVENVSPWPVGSYAARPTTVRYRYTWITPLAISPVPPHAIYQGAQVLFRSTDGGHHWETISPDLTGAVPGTKGCDGDVPVARATACGYGVLYTIAPSPRDASLVWVGTDNGLVHLTRDGGKTWTNVSPPGLPDWSKIASIDASPTDPATAYLAVDRHRKDDFTPHVYRTHDSGSTWTEVSAGLPAASFVNVVRQDPVEPRLLYAGTRTGAFVSFDDGLAWQPLQLDLPTTGVNDLTVHGNDLVAATQGRGLWVLDDVSPLRALARGVPPGPHLFPPAPAFRLRANENRDTPLPAEEPTTANPPAGAVIDYELPSAPSGPVTLEILDAEGRILARRSNAEAPASAKAERYFTEDWLRSEAPLAAQPGHHRFVWNLRGPRPPAVAYEYSIAAVPGADTPALPEGALVLPGRYEVRLTVGGQAESQPLVVLPDPRAHATDADLRAQLQLGREVAEALGRTVAAYDEIGALAGRLHALAERLGAEKKGREAREAAARLEADLGRFRSGGGEEDLSTLGGVLAALATDLEAADGPPTEPQRQVLETYGRRLASAVARWNALRDEPLARLDALLRKAGLPALGGAAVKVPRPAAAGGSDRPRP